MIKTFNQNGHIFFSIDELNVRYNHDNHFNFTPHLYLRMTNAVSNNIREKNLDLNCMPSLLPPQSSMCSFVNLQKKGAAKWGRIIKRGSLKRDNIDKREKLTLNRYGIRIWHIDYSLLYKLNSKIKWDNHIRFFHFLLIRDGLHTNVQRAKYAGISEECSFCHNFRETSQHLLWGCDHVMEFRNEITNNISNEFNFLKLVPNTPKDRILGYRFIGGDNFEFAFYTYINRFIWISKLKNNPLELRAFKNYLNHCLKIQLAAGIMTCLEMVNINNIWRQI